MRFSISYFVVLDLFVLSSATKTCYWPSGKTAGALTPCNDTLSVSHCCKESDVCISNGLCFSPGLGVLVRRGCTDRSWNSTECPSYCLADKYKAADIVMTVCDTYGDFCCGQDDDARTCCNLNGTEQPEKIGTGSVILAEKWCPLPPPEPNVTVIFNSTDPQFQQVKRAAIGLGVVLGVSLLVLVSLLTDWIRMRRTWKGPIIRPRVSPQVEKS